MSLGISEDQVALAASVRKWAASLDGVEATRRAEGDPTGDAEQWAFAVDDGIRDWAAAGATEKGLAGRLAKEISGLVAR